MKRETKPSIKPGTPGRRDLSKQQDKDTIRLANEELRQRQQHRLETIVAELMPLLINEAKSKWAIGKLVDEEATAYTLEERDRLRLDAGAKQVDDERHEQTRIGEIALRVNRDVRTILNWRYFYRALPDFSRYDARLHFMHYVRLYEVRDKISVTKQTELLAAAAENQLSTREFKAQLAEADSQKSPASDTAPAATTPPAVAVVESLEPNAGAKLAKTIKTTASQLERLLEKAIVSPELVMMFRTEDLNELIKVTELISTVVDRIGNELGADVLEAA